MDPYGETHVKHIQRLYIFIIPQHDLYWRDHTCFHILISFSCFFSERIWNRSGSSTLYLRDGLLDSFVFYSMTLHIMLLFQIFENEIKESLYIHSDENISARIELIVYIPCLKTVKICNFMAILVDFS